MIEVEIMPGRQGSGGNYRYGFNGKEMDNDMRGGNTWAVYDYGFRIYDSRIAKFLSVDPLIGSYPWYTPYQFAGNKPIEFFDLDGLEEIHYYFAGQHLFTIINSEITQNKQNEVFYYVIHDDPKKNMANIIEPWTKIPKELELTFQAPPKEIDLVGIGATTGICVGGGSHFGAEIVVPTKGKIAFIPGFFHYEGRTEILEGGNSAYYLTAHFFGNKNELDFENYEDYFRSINLNLEASVSLFWGFRKERDDKGWIDFLKDGLIEKSEIAWTGVAYSLPTPTSIPSVSYRRSKYKFDGKLDVTIYTAEQWKNRYKSIDSDKVTKDIKRPSGNPPTGSSWQY